MIKLWEHYPSDFKLSFFFILLLGLTLGCGTTRFRSPKVISDKKLDYPLSAQINKIEGSVVVGVFVSKEGQPAEVRLFQSSGSKDLDNAALKFARETQFEPALLDGKPIGAWTKLILRYKLSEVYFEEERWLSNVLLLQGRAVTEKDSVKREAILKTLYTKYVGLVNYVNRREYDVEINYSISRTLSKMMRQRYKPFMKVIPITFAVFDDFLEKYPDSPIAARAREDLLQQLVEGEYRIRLRALKSSSFTRKTLPLIDYLESRIKELQKLQ